ncbi:NAD-dependent epimerase [Brachybacterium avium]|uniref:NAD-dependent epimerase n=1 Tax=Brachybacterium avium TaxID=2017485 RepID=A0A220UBP7_9MICO|nr:NAD(P)H-binding protein [Brachybacterium avium]ASK65103.1 NAD-dependent epimerase [Brachybacterium avium]
MSRIIILGGTGYAGGHLVAEAARRGHNVLAVSRSTPASLPDGASHRAGDLREEALLQEVLTGADVVIATSSPRGDLAAPGVLRSAYVMLARLAAEQGVRLGVIGGAGSLQVAPGGPLLVDIPDFPAEFADEARELGAVLEDLRASGEGLDWFYVSPAAGFGNYAPGEATGSYRIGGDVLLSDAEGESRLSGADLALAVIDEIETPAHHRMRFSLAY